MHQLRKTVEKIKNSKPCSCKQYVDRWHTNGTDSSDTAREDPCCKMLPSSICGEIVSKTERSKDMVTVSTNSGMKGNVSTYHLNIEDIADLVDPVIKPPIPAVHHDRHQYSRTTESSWEDDAQIFSHWEGPNPSRGEAPRVDGGPQTRCIACDLYLHMVGAYYIWRG